MDNPTIVARFDLDQQGRPKMHEAGGHKHYVIQLHVDGVPEDTYAVTYQLHETYYNPSRESRRRSSGFSEEITSYGDYPVIAKVRSSQHARTITATLSQALTRGHGLTPSPYVAEAITDIRNN